MATKMDKLENKRSKLLMDIERTQAIVEKETQKLQDLKARLEAVEYEITAALMIENDVNLDQLKELLQMDGVKELLTPTSQNTNSYSEVQEQSLAEEGV